MRDADRDRLALFDLAVLPRLDVAGDLDGAAVEVEEPEAVAAAGGLQLAGLADQLHALGAELRGERVDRGGALGAERDQVEALLVGLAQADDVLLRRALGGEVREVAVGARPR